MIGQLEAKHTVFERIETLLSPENLSAITGKTVTGVSETPIDHGGLAGGTISHIHTNVGRYILKRMSIESDYIMQASSDIYCRSVTLWQYGLLDEIASFVDHEIIACARDGDGWALLMNDLTGHVFAWNRAPSTEQSFEFLDVMARFHAKFWNDQRLMSPELGVCNSREILEMSSLDSALQYANDSQSVIPEWIQVGWQSLSEILPDSLYAPMRSLLDDPQPLLDKLASYPKTLVHGDYRADNLAYTDHPIALDWQEAAYTLMTVDLAWFIKHGYVDRDEGVRFYREKLEHYLGLRFDAEEWSVMLDLGYCVDALRSASFPGYFYTLNAENAEYQANDERMIRFHAQSVLKAMKYL